MEKIKLTQEQEVALYRFSSNSAVINKWFKGFDSPYHKCLEKLTIDQLCRVLYTPDSYEVIPQFNAGDWVINFDKRAIGKIEFVDENTYYGKWYKHPGDDETMECGTDAFSRHATDNEKKKGFWWSIGREVDEYKHGDIVSYQDLFTPLIGSELDNREVHFPSNSRPNSFVIPIEDVRLSIPVEQRLDK